MIYGGNLNLKIWIINPFNIPTNLSAPSYSYIAITNKEYKPSMK